MCYFHSDDSISSVLNLNKGASQAEINERHRALSLVFHPDKQHDERSKAIATKKFLEIQKAYQGEHVYSCP
jgi:DnaJ family protein C protein 11